MQVKLNLHFQGRDCTVTCDYQPAEDDNNVAEDLDITELDMDGYTIIGEVDGNLVNRLTIDQSCELSEATWEKFAEFLQAHEEAKYSNDTTVNPFGSWL